MPIIMNQLRILALDYGRIHTGAAISDPTGTIVRPLDPVRDANSEQGIGKISVMTEQEGANAVVVGMPVSLNGERGAQARETEIFIEALEKSLDLPVFTWDERFTSKMAAAKGRFSDSDPHSLAACCLLEDYLASEEFQRRTGRA
jgi:putative Holliday junction resolvase